MQEQESTPTGHRAGFVALAGKPNVGKSTLINAFLGQKIAAVTFRPQTTRRQQLGILTRNDTQAVFIDTPGIHDAHHQLGDRMNAEAFGALDEADLLLVLVDASQPPDSDDVRLAEAIAEHAGKLEKILVLNKIDRTDPETLAAHTAGYTSLFPDIPEMPISAQTGEHLAALIEMIFDRLPEGLPFYPPDQVTDLYERELAADLIREAALLHLRDEIPHSIAVRIDGFKERGEKGARIEATLFVERDSQIGIVVGRGGAMLKQIGMHARKEIEAMSGRKIHLDLRVKVRKNWRNDAATLSNFGFNK